MRHSKAEVGAEWIRQGGPPSRVLEAIAVATAESNREDEAENSCCAGVWALHEMHTPRSCAKNFSCATKRAVEIFKETNSFKAWVVHPEGSALAAYDPNQPQAVRNYERALRSIKNDSRLVSLFDDPLGLGIPDAIGGAVGDVFGGGGSDITQAGREGVTSDIGGLMDPLVDPIKGIANFFIGAGELLFTPEGWKRVGFIGGGAVMLLIGLNAVMKSGYGVNAGGTVKKAATVAATKGAIK